jgi:hypothetical protein
MRVESSVRGGKNSVNSANSVRLTRSSGSQLGKGYVKGAESRECTTSRKKVAQMSNGRRQRWDLS